MCDQGFFDVEWSQRGEEMGINPVAPDILMVDLHLFLALFWAIFILNFSKE